MILKSCLTFRTRSHSYSLCWSHSFGRSVLPTSLENATACRFPASFSLPLRRTAACGRGCGVRRPLRGHLWWPCEHGIRAGACGRASKVDRCASFVLIPRRAALLNTVAMNRSCAGHVVAQSKLRRTNDPSVRAYRKKVPGSQSPYWTALSLRLRVYRLHERVRASANGCQYTVR
jgi:hypothetical protein